MTNLKMLVTFLALPVLAGCSTTSVKLSDSLEAPADRVHGFKTRVGDDTAELVVVRDVGALGSFCRYSIWVGKEIAATLETGERVTLSILPGEHILSVAPAPGSGFLCSIGDPVRTIESTFKPREKKTYRMFISAGSGVIDLQRID